LTGIGSGGNTAYHLVGLIAEGFEPDSDRVYDATYHSTLRRMVAKVIETEGPIFEDCLVSRIAAAHGFGRSGGQIRSTIVDVVERRFPSSIEADGEGKRRILWPEGADCRAFSIFRCGLRDHADIPLAELASPAREFINEGLDEEEAVRRMAECRFPPRTDPGFPLRTDPGFMMV
jgi:hypothetical protein